MPLSRLGALRYPPFAARRPALSRFSPPSALRGLTFRHSPALRAISYRRSALRCRPLVAAWRRALSRLSPPGAALHLSAPICDSKLKKTLHAMLIMNTVVTDTI
eukprot:6179932-Pleurochrysis_carterae.AAC.1